MFELCLYGVKCTIFDLVGFLDGFGFKVIVYDFVHGGVVRQEGC